ncbi:glycosyltransferase [Cupriavidus sp. SZY C1]|uniref:glycosyltransferase family 4 protein n=1 Tax=Cupriavidus sp. SZY C1 TaxID=3055037 RepID=UPI0028B5B5A4|nr:glycosyltransferase [Cupriavidus sp. SZY C1]MDT6962828.1 glycosyltransferase [Cupriavidus sp. SZY C1]
MKLFKKMWADQAGGQAAALVATADAARDARDWGTAAAHYRQALDARPELAPIWVQYGHALKESGNLVEARAAYRRALGLAPDVADTHLQMGHAAKLAGELEEAAACYAQALTLAPGHDDALRELHALALRGIRVDMHPLRGAWNRAPAMVPADDPVAALSAMLDAARAAAAHPAHPTNAAHAEAARLAREQLASAVEILRRIDRDALQATRPAGQGATIVFDATDLIHHFRGSRLPTGIQRVQLELISAACRATDPAHPAPMVCYLGDQGWLEVPGALFAQLCRICLGHGDAPPAAWQQTLMQLDTLMLGSAPMAFPRGAWLVSLGTSWFPEYLLHVRLARQRYGIRYVPFVHDLIPVVMPEHCVDDLVDRFAAWLLGAFAHADRFLVNSESTRRDLEAAAARLGQPLPAGHVEVVRLDADIRKPGLRAPEAANMQGWGWSRQPFVLMLSTVEPRKNHLAAFRAWRSLIDHHGARHVPQLVCVGARGWKNEAALAMLDNDPVLASRVTILSGLADPQVALLLERCLFTLYPSLYEGWGLPVTESLCHGKVPAVSDVASLPEAGGLLADYFDPQSPGELLRVVEKLIFDVPYRRSREQRIAAEFRPRTWQQLGDQIAQAVHRWQGGIGDAQPAAPAPTLAAGRFYPMAAPRRLPLAQGTVVTESLRAGDGWHGVEDWGCWSRPGDSRLAMRLADDLADARVRVYLCVRGLPSRATQYRLECGDGPRSEGRLDAGRERWIAIDVDAPPPGQPLELSLHADVHESLGETTQGADARVIGPAVLGVYVCAADDTAARLRLVEAVTLGSLDALAVPAETDRFLLAARQTSQLLAGL